MRINLKVAMGDKPKETKSAGGVVVNNKGQVLVVNQRGRSWSLPKGHFGKSEDALETAKREIYEESGIKQLKLIRDLGEYKRYKIDNKGGEDSSELKIIVMFLFRTAEDNLKPVDPENPEARWIEKEKVAEILTHPKDKKFFLSVINEI